MDQCQKDKRLVPCSCPVWLLFWSIDLFCSPETLKVDEDSKDQKTATTGKKRARTVKSGEKSLTETDKSTVAENNAPAETVEKSAKPKRQKASAKSGVEKSEDEKLVNKIADEEVEKEAVPKKRKTAAKSKKATVESAVEADDETLGNVETVEKPKKKRKPTAKQLEEAEAAARPRYDPEKDRPPPCTDLETITILGWNVTSLNATLRKDPDAISKLVNDNGADVICLQVWKISLLNEGYCISINVNQKVRLTRNVCWSLVCPSKSSHTIENRSCFISFTRRYRDDGVSISTLKWFHSSYSNVSAFEFAIHWNV